MNGIEHVAVGRERPARRRALHSLYVVTYAGFAALGSAVLAPPAVFWIRGFGLDGPALAPTGSLGWASAGLVSVLAASTLSIAIAAALGRKPSLPWHTAFLALVACGLAGRAGIAPATPPDPAPALRDALRATAAALDASYGPEHRYDPDVRALQDALDALPRTSFRLHGRTLGYAVRLITNARGPRIDVLAGDLPATVYVAVAPGAQNAWISVTTLREGRVEVLPATVEARSGTHSDPGQDLLLPRYPRIRAVPR